MPPEQEKCVQRTPGGNGYHISCPWIRRLSQRAEKRGLQPASLPLAQIQPAGIANPGSQCMRINDDVCGGMCSHPCASEMRRRLPRAVPQSGAGGRSPTPSPAWRTDHPSAGSSGCQGQPPGSARVPQGTPGAGGADAAKSFPPIPRAAWWPGRPSVVRPSEAAEQGVPLRPMLPWSMASGCKPGRPAPPCHASDAEPAEGCGPERPPQFIRIINIMENRCSIWRYVRGLR